MREKLQAMWRRKYSSCRENRKDKLIGDRTDISVQTAPVESRQKISNAAHALLITLYETRPVDLILTMPPFTPKLIDVGSVPSPSLCWLGPEAMIVCIPSVG